jgi:D-alanyl-D-alanine carboxypeptidase
MVLLLGTDGPWIGPEWNEWLDARPVEDRGPVRIVGLDPVRVERATPPADTVYVPAPLALTAADVPDSLVELPSPPASRDGLRVTPPTARALERLLEAARQDGIELRIISAYRSFGRQKRLYERAIERHGPDQRWVAAPGTSEHQLGTTVDFADAALAHAVEPSFGDTPEGRWLARHAEDFGFVQSYTEANQDRTGYRPEPWHYRHRPELAGDARR